MGAGSRLSLRLLAFVARLGGRVTTNVRIQDMDIVAPNRLDERRVEVLGCPYSTGPKAVDTTGVCVGPKWGASSSVCRR